MGRSWWRDGQSGGVGDAKMGLWMDEWMVVGSKGERGQREKNISLMKDRSTPRYATPRHATPRYATPRHTTPRNAMLQWLHIQHQTPVQSGPPVCKRFFFEEGATKAVGLAE